MSKLLVPSHVAESMERDAVAAREREAARVLVDAKETLAARIAGVCQPLSPDSPARTAVAAVCRALVRHGSQFDPGPLLTPDEAGQMIAVALLGTEVETPC